MYKKRLTQFNWEIGICFQGVRPGRLFLRRLIDLSTSVKLLHHRIYLNTEAHHDIDWWLRFLPTWNRTSIIPDSFTISNQDLKLHTDASGRGLGGIYDDRWIQAPWQSEFTAPSSTTFNIDFLELFAIYAACVTWGTEWAGKRIVIATDNSHIIDAWHAGTSKSKPIMLLICKLFLFAAQQQFSLSLKFIPGKQNNTADHLSRFQMQKFRQTSPNAALLPTPMPTQVWDLTNCGSE